ncbi:tyrosine-type recombinase/integrase [Homoserinibacter sp. GY 40078]|uniref:tyrosine-type recombinase/integrase n=1 Tax=Homoserinibacter sp. GY 40078 TaxID=2603275 RepID=UPI001C9C22AD|nr:tyrosine-type recombinase/integrase [Homoserinibacter sp. GY 40078]
MTQQVTPSAPWASPIRGYLDHLTASRSPKPTITLRSYYLRRFAADIGIDPWGVTARDLVDYINNSTWGPSAVKSFRSTMREFYRWATLSDLTTTNPAERLPRVRVPVGSPRPAPESSLEDGLGVADPRTRMMIRLAALAGLRCREIALVQGDDVERDLLGWSLRVQGKGGRMRRVPISDDLAAEILGHAGYLFPGQVEGHLSAQYVSKLISRALPGATAHQLRHRYATRAYQHGGRDIRAVQELLGHASVATTQVYTAVDPDSLRQAALAAA